AAQVISCLHIVWLHGYGALQIPSRTLVVVQQSVIQTDDFEIIRHGGLKSGSLGKESQGFRRFIFAKSHVSKQVEGIVRLGMFCAIRIKRCPCLSEASQIDERLSEEQQGIGLSRRGSLDPLECRRSFTVTPLLEHLLRLAETHALLGDTVDHQKGHSENGPRDPRSQALALIHFPPARQKAHLVPRIGGLLVLSWTRQVLEAGIQPLSLAFQNLLLMQVRFLFELLKCCERFSRLIVTTHL